MASGYFKCAKANKMHTTDAEVKSICLGGFIGMLSDIFDCRLSLHFTFTALSKLKVAQERLMLALHIKLIPWLCIIQIMANMSICRNKVRISKPFPFLSVLVFMCSTHSFPRHVFCMHSQHFFHHMMVVKTNNRKAN